ncbi:hypothetical protein CXU19_02460 [Akkermansia muciniphila]|nr:hypothetical protein CXU19_02460 [Akkermansia muciniphila]
MNCRPLSTGIQAFLFPVPVLCRLPALSGKMNLPPCGRLPPDRKRRHAEKEHEIFHLICVA